MDYIEANEWLKGERSTCSMFMALCENNETANVMMAQADAAMCQQAYWMVRAKNEKLTF